MNPVIQHLRPTETAQKSILKHLKYKAKQEAKKLAHFEITPENESKVWHSLSQSIFSIGYASFHTKLLKEKGAIMQDDRLVEYANDLETKFETFRKSLPIEKQREYIETRNVMEDFFYRVSLATAEELKRTIGFLESLQGKR